MKVYRRYFFIQHVEWYKKINNSCLISAQVQSTISQKFQSTSSRQFQSTSSRLHVQSVISQKFQLTSSRQFQSTSSRQYQSTISFREIRSSPSWFSKFSFVENSIGNVAFTAGFLVSIPKAA